MELAGRGGECQVNGNVGGQLLHSPKTTISAIFGIPFKSRQCGEEWRGVARSGPSQNLLSHQQ